MTGSYCSCLVVFPRLSASSHMLETAQVRDAIKGYTQTWRVRHSVSRRLLLLLQAPALWKISLISLGRVASWEWESLFLFFSHLFSHGEAYYRWYAWEWMDMTNHAFGSNLSEWGMTQRYTFKSKTCGMCGTDHSIQYEHLWHWKGKGLNKGIWTYSLRYIVLVMMRFGKPAMLPGTRL